MKAKLGELWGVQVFTCELLATGFCLAYSLLHKPWLCALDVTRTVLGNKNEPNTVTI